MPWSDDSDSDDDDDYDKNNFNSSYCLYHTVYIGMYSSVSDEHAASVFKEKLLSSFLILFILCAVHVVVYIRTYPNYVIHKLEPSYMFQRPITILREITVQRNTSYLIHTDILYIFYYNCTCETINVACSIVLTSHWWWRIIAETRRKVQVCV